MTGLLAVRTVDQLTIGDESSFEHVALYAALKRVLVDAKYAFRVLPPTKTPRWDRALLLNLTFWGAPPDAPDAPDAPESSGGGDVLVDEQLEADVVTHVAWHHLARRALSGSEATAEAMFLGEAIASAFDLYLVGRLIGHSPDSSFLASQVPAMADAAEAAGLSERGFERILEAVAKDPERAFEDLRALLFDATTALLACRNADEAYAALASFDGHRFSALLHHYELSNWVLYARAYAPNGLGRDAKAREVDAALRAVGGGLAWLERAWLDGAPGA